MALQNVCGVKKIKQIAIGAISGGFFYQADAQYFWIGTFARFWLKAWATLFCSFWDRRIITGIAMAWFPGDKVCPFFFRHVIDFF
ncbi:MAG: hypothetical protein CM15mP120_20070 [Pseudomonadota bacterium]|nr:MAG: hypothetical protein CM15mP120_20070 [Pseudomonadota bacterium]